MSLEKKGCLHFQKGYCKFGPQCRFEHVKELCKKESCDIEDCKLRHPINCKFFAVYGNCKFGTYRAYSHLSSKESDKIIKLEQSLLETNSKIKKQETEIISLKNLIHTLNDFDNVIESLRYHSPVMGAEATIPNERHEPKLCS